MKAATSHNFLCCLFQDGMDIGTKLRRINRSLFTFLCAQTIPQEIVHFTLSLLIYLGCGESQFLTIKFLDILAINFTKSIATTLQDLLIRILDT